MTFMKTFLGNATGAMMHFAAIVAFVPSSWAADEARAQGVPNAMQGFSQNRDQPIKIEAASLEMRQRKNEATFSGGVKVVQGDTIMTSGLWFGDGRRRAASIRARQFK